MDTMSILIGKFPPILPISFSKSGALAAAAELVVAVPVVFLVLLEHMHSKNYQELKLFLDVHIQSKLANQEVDLLLLAETQEERHLSLDLIFPISVLMVVMLDVLAATCAAVLGQLFAMFAAMVLVLYTMVLMVALTETLELDRCGASATIAGTSNCFLTQVV